MNLTKFFNETIPVLEAGMHDTIQKSLDTRADLLNEIFIYHLGMDKDRQARGKRIRPLLVFLTTHAFQVDWKRALQAAAAVEFLHNFSLIHDDVEDRSEQRHGRPTVWAKWGQAQAINAGDGMFTLVFHSARLLERFCPAETVIAAIDLISQACLHLVEGQVMDVAFEKRNDISIPDYYRMIDGKTASLLACCTQLGGLIANVDATRMVLLKEFGYNLGRAFQVQDDLLGIWGDPQETGKPVESDLANHKHTLPVLYGLQSSSRFRKKWIAGGILPDEVPLVSSWLMEDGIYSQVESELNQLNEAADKNMMDMQFTSSEGSSLIRELILKLRKRKK
jgi:geranylgeranyl diphosphate synthase, type I